MTTAAIRELLNPTTLTLLKSHLGICNAVHRFVPSFSDEEAPLNVKLRKEQGTLLSSLYHEKNATDNLKTILTNFWISPLSCTEQPFTVNIDASGSPVRCMLPQTQENGTYRSSGDFSCTLAKGEQKLKTTYKERLAVVKEFSQGENTRDWTILSLVHTTGPENSLLTSADSRSSWYDRCTKYSSTKPRRHTELLSSTRHMTLYLRLW